VRLTGIGVAKIPVGWGRRVYETPRGLGIGETFCNEKVWKERMMETVPNPHIISTREAKVTPSPYVEENKKARGDYEKLVGLKTRGIKALRLGSGAAMINLSTTNRVKREICTWGVLSGLDKPQPDLSSEK